MTLQEALQSGKKLNRLINDNETFFSFEGYKDTFDIIDLDVLATDWVVEPDAPVTLTVTEATLAAAWDKARGNATTIGAAANSPLFKRLVAALKVA